GAILIWLLPLSSYATGSLALLFSFAEVGFWIRQATHFAFSQPGLQMSQRANWFGDLGVSYHVGVYGFSLWLVGLTVVGMAACTGYGFWVGRDRPRAYFGLMLLLTGATVGVFESQDLLLFYAFFEAMLIPLYVLIGVWGGALRMEAALEYGSLLAFRSPDFRGVVAYSSLAQSGLIALGLFAGTDLGFDGAVLQMVAHGLISISLFLVAGAVERRTTTGEFRLLGGMARGRPALVTLLMIVGVISLAVPGSASFAGEFLILAGVFQR